MKSYDDQVAQSEEALRDDFGVCTLCETVEHTQRCLFYALKHPAWWIMDSDRNSISYHEGGSYKNAIAVAAEYIESKEDTQRYDAYAILYFGTEQGFPEIAEDLFSHRDEAQKKYFDSQVEAVRVRIRKVRQEYDAGDLTQKGMDGRIGEIRKTCGEKILAEIDKTDKLYADIWDSALKGMK